MGGTIIEWSTAGQMMTSRMIVFLHFNVLGSSRTPSCSITGGGRFALATQAKGSPVLPLGAVG